MRLIDIITNPEELTKLLKREAVEAAHNKLKLSMNTLTNQRMQTVSNMNKLKRDVDNYAPVEIYKCQLALNKIDHEMEFYKELERDQFLADAAH